MIDKRRAQSLSSPAMSRDPAALSELLDDLRHDLAKYLRLPLRLLPRDPDPELLREALERALIRTQQNAAGTRSARQIYARYRPELERLADSGSRLRAVDAAAEAVFAWEAALDGERALDRAAIERDFETLAAVIDGWCNEASRG